MTESYEMRSARELYQYYRITVLSENIQRDGGEPRAVWDPDCCMYRDNLDGRFCEKGHAVEILDQQALELGVERDLKE